MMVLRLLEAKLGVRTPDIHVMPSGMYVVPKVSTCIPISMFPALVTTLFIPSFSPLSFLCPHSLLPLLPLLLPSPRPLPPSTPEISYSKRRATVSIKYRDTHGEYSHHFHSKQVGKVPFLLHWENPLSPPLEWVSFHWRGPIPILNTLSARG